MLCAEQANICRSQTAAAFREWNVVVKMQILRRATLDALIVIAAPDFDLDGGRNQTVVREFHDAAE